MREKNDRTHARVARPYVRDAARTERGAFEEAAVSAAMVALSLAAGFCRRVFGMGGAFALKLAGLAAVGHVWRKGGRRLCGTLVSACRMHAGRFGHRRLDAFFSRSPCIA